MRKGFVVIFPILAAMLAMVGCGGGSATSTMDTGGAGSTVAGRDEATPPTEAEARRYAEAVNLKQSDVDSSELEAGGPEQISPDAEFEQCLGSEAKPIITVESAQFSGARTGAFEQVGSEVTVASDDGDVAQLLSDLESPKAAGCLKSVVEGAASGKPNVRFGNSSVIEIPGDHPDDEVALRLDTPVIVDEGEGSDPVPLYFDIRGFPEGPALVTLLSVGTGDPPNTEDEERFIAILRGRAALYSLDGGTPPPGEEADAGG